MGNLFVRLIDYVSMRRKIRKFQRALEREDIDGIIEYVKAGGNVNVILEVVDVCEGVGFERKMTPLEIALGGKTDVIVDFLREKGAVTLKELESQIVEKSNAYAREKIKEFEDQKRE